MKPLNGKSTGRYSIPLVVGLLIAISYSFLDAPMNQFIDNMKVSSRSKNVEDINVTQFAEGDDVGYMQETTNS